MGFDTEAAPTGDSYETAEQLDTLPAHGAAHGDAKKAPLWRRVLWEGGFPADGFLTAASAQVGQVLLNLPNSTAKLSLAGGILVQAGCAAAAVWTLFLLVALYMEYKRTEVRRGTWFDGPNSKTRSRVTQYHSVITATTGLRWFGEFARAVNVIELLGLAVAQIIASASNFYSLRSGLSKRDFTFVFGAVCMLFLLIPGMRNMRPFSFLALLGTTYTAWYMMGMSWANWNAKTVAASARRPPLGPEEFFQAFSNIVFTFGGHCMLMEVVDSQWRPSRFPPTFGAAIGYVTAALTLPSAVFTFLAFPQQATQFGNAFAIFPPSAAKNAGIILMVAHQIVAFALFALPVCVMWEKLVGTHSKPKPLRLLSRIPVGLLIWFIALAIPFFGVINDVLGAFCVTFETYVIPATAWCLYYRKKENRDAAVLQPPRWLGGWTGAFVLNAAVILIFLVAGLGAGGYSSIVALVEAVGTFGLFAKCYNC